MRPPNAVMKSAALELEQQVTIMPSKGRIVIEAALRKIKSWRICCRA
jgi:antitoxin component of MazEF toxin-antitoxin module